MRLTLKIWRQAGPNAPGRFAAYTLDDVSPDISFLELLDLLNERLILQGEDAIAFDHDCREGVCGSCGLMISGVAHGPQRLTTACQLYMRHFEDGQTVVAEPFRSRAFPVIKDLIVDRSALDTIIQAGGYISVRTGSAPEAHSVLVPKHEADRAMDAAACIGCGACVAACPNASAMLFTAAKVSHLGLLPQGQPERRQRVLRMVSAMLELGFGSCSNHGECEAVCPKGISLDFIARLNRDFLKASLRERAQPIERV
jgi:succinate dehydrogenase / fumarate reductase iron-sulfur subunit